MRFNINQKKSLSNYSGNLSIAWFAAGFIGPIVTKQDSNQIGWIMVLSILISSIFLTFMLTLLKGKKI